MSLRKRIENSDRLAASMAFFAARYLMLCNRLIRWRVEGLEEVQAALKDGPVLYVMWHSRSIMGPVHWPLADGPLSSLFDSSPIGRIGGEMQRQVGLQPIKMSRKRANRAASRLVLQRIRDGVSIGMAADGPLGPPLVFSDAALSWVRVTGAPVFCYAYSARRHRRLGSWDKMMLPRLFGQGARVYKRVELTLPPKPNAEALEAMRETIQQTLNDTMARADELAGVPPGP